MRGYGSMIRLHKWQVDDRRRALAELETRGQELQFQLKRLDGEMATEAELVKNDPAAGNTYAAYLSAATLRRELLMASIHAMGQQIVAAQESLGEAYRELKKYELAEENRQQRLELERSRREQTELDEVALNMYRRQESN